MTHGPDAEIVYGYFLGGPGEWEFAEADEYGGPDYELFPWFSEDDEESFSEALERRLDAGPVDDVEIVWCGGSPGYMFLYAHRVTRSSAAAMPFDAGPMERDTDHWDAALGRALDHLGITLPDDEPGWHLLLSWE
jgi:hypothetical protein